MSVSVIGGICAVGLVIVLGFIIFASMSIEDYFKLKPISRKPEDKKDHTGGIIIREDLTGLDSFICTIQGHVIDDLEDQDNERGPDE